MNNHIQNSNIITYEDVRNNKDIQTYISSADEILDIAGYTKHDFGHVSKVAETAAYILNALGYDGRNLELAKIAGFMHDIGNMINRQDHAQTGALLTFHILKDMGMDPQEIFLVTAAIGNHDEGTGQPVNLISSALILADKVDVRRSRVRNADFATFDIHDRVNYAVEKSAVYVNKEDKLVQLSLTIDTKICSLMEYFEIFLNRMMLCRKASNFLNTKFELVMNDTKVL